MRAWLVFGKANMCSQEHCVPDTHINLFLKIDAVHSVMFSSLNFFPFLSVLTKHKVNDSESSG